MTDFLQSLKADLLDRRFLPLLALLVVALVGALTYAFLGGGSSTSSTPAKSLTTAGGSTIPSGGVTASQAATNANEAVAETTNGTPHQHAGPTRDPFTPLLTTKTKLASSSGAQPSSGTAHGTGSNSSSQSGSDSSPKNSGGTTPQPSPKPAKPAPPRRIYEVDVLFGAAPAGTPSANIQLTPLTDLARLDPLTANGETPLVFAGVLAGGGSAIFTLVSEVILHGPASCHPSASQCQAIGLLPGQSEEFESTTPAGQALIFKLELVSINAVKASAAKAARVFHAESSAGRTLLRNAGLSALPGLRYSVQQGVVVLPGHHAFGAHAARARAARRR